MEATHGISLVAQYIDIIILLGLAFFIIGVLSITTSLNEMNHSLKKISQALESKNQ